MLICFIAILMEWVKKERERKDTEAVCACFFLLPLSYAEGDPNSWIDGVGLAVHQKSNKGSNSIEPHKYKTLPISVRLDGRTWNTHSCGKIWRYQHWEWTAPNTQACFHYLLWLRRVNVMTCMINLCYFEIIFKNSSIIYCLR